ncbi:uncharacterized protein LOC128224402 isoform X2 [Mya arenaria]|uniref:uncharacterized protein LOC128224402 isoform X2 n=1 Tax=Mya arenaria TaxID=6604 RepID=UPI0022E2E8E9|nr:uncharacterized protein LOC128224402 isoform X2 [Mya arenaria]
MGGQGSKTDVCDGEVPGRMPSTDRIVVDCRNDDCVAGRIISGHSQQSHSSNYTSETTPLLHQDPSFVANKELTTNPDEEREICYLCCTRAATHYDFGACCSACCLCIGNTCRNGCIRGQICMDDCAQSCGICMHDCGDKVSCDGGIGDAVCECGKGINTGLSFLGAGIYTGFALLGQCCYEICSVQLLMHLSLPLCSMSIAISSVVLPYWAWGETNKIAVGLFKCCNFTEENRNSNQSECLLLSDCLSSDFKSHLVIKAASGLQITYIVLHGITILLVTISQQKDDYSYKPAARQLCNGFVVLLAVAICYIGVIVFLSGVIQSQHLKGGPPRLSINLAMISCVVYLSYAAVCFGQPKVLICVPTSTALVYLVIFMMTNKTVLIVVLVLIGLFILGTLIALLMKCRK